MKTFILTGRNNEVIRNYLKQIPYDGTYKMEIKKVQSKRSLAQNDLYWMWLTIMGDEFGNTKDEMHDIMRFKLLNPVVTEAMGEVVSQLPSTTKMKVKEFTQYLQAIERFASEMGVILPHPEDKYYEAMGHTRGQSNA
jgi:hypothetical protein